MRGHFRKGQWQRIAIYCLIDPEIGDARYVGQTKRPSQRLKGFLTVKSGSEAVRDWIGHCRYIGKSPSYRILDRVWSKNANFVESTWICALRLMGHRLLNSLSMTEKSHVEFTARVAEVVASGDRVSVPEFQSSEYRTLAEALDTDFFELVADSAPAETAETTAA